MHQEHTENKWLSLYLFPALILGVFLIGYWPVFQKMMIRWDAGDSSYCYLIVPLFAYLLWDLRAKGRRHSAKGIGQELENRKEERGRDKDQGLRDTGEGLDTPQTSNLKPNATEGIAKGFAFGDFSWNMWGLVPIALSVLLVIIGEIGSVETFLYFGIWGCAVGMIFILYGRRLRYLVFPLLILLFIVPLPPFVNQMLTFQLKLMSSTLSVIFLRLTGISVLQQGNIIDLGVSQLQVVDACSGMRYLMPLLLTALLVGYFFNKKLWQKIVLVLVVLPLSIFVNAVRIWITGILTVNGYARLAQSFFHDFSGWLIYMIAGAVLVAAALVLRRIGSRIKDQGLRIRGQGPEVRSQEKDQSSKLKAQGSKLSSSNELNQSNQSNLSSEIHDSEGHCPFHRDPSNHSTNWMKSALITVILCLLFAASGRAIKTLPSAGNLPQRTAFDSFPMKIGQWQGERHYLPKDILDQLWADDYISATYKQPGTANLINLFIPFYSYQGTRHTAHAPQSCMLGSGWALFNSNDRMINLNPHEKINIRTMTWKKGEYKLLGSYFFFQRGRVITSPYINKLYLMVDAFTKRRTDGALVRVEMPIAPGQSMETAYKTLEGFIAKIWPILPTYIPS